MNTSRSFASTFVVGALVINTFLASHAVADAVCCANTAPPTYVLVTESIDETPKEPSWIFAPSTFTHDPTTGARVAQYERKPPVEPLEDERNITSRYRRTRTGLRGTDGSYDVYYQVQSWGNDRGGLDSEWERFHDAWKESELSGGYYNGPAYGGGGWGGNGGGWNNGGWNNGGWNGGGWNNGGNWNNGGGWGGPGPGNGGWNGPPNGGGWNGNGPNNGPPGNWHHNQSHHDDNDS